MSVSKVLKFERFFDRTGAVFLVILGLALGGATALVGA